MPNISSRSFIKIIRNTLLIIFVVGLFLFIALFLYSLASPANKERAENDKPGSEKMIPQVSDQFPEETKFVQQYFSHLQAQEYDILLKSYWTPSVVNEIRQNCSSPLGEEPSTTTESLWLNCEHLQEITVEIIAVEKQNIQSMVTIQLFDKQGDIVGLELHPEWVRGHQIILKQSEAGFRTDNWKFL